MKKVIIIFSVVFISACSKPSQYQNEFGNMNGVNGVGMTDTYGMSSQEMHARINKARLEGLLTSEQARSAHTQLDVKGHLTAEQIAIINRDRLAARHEYESNKETLDVLRDVTQSGSSMISDVRDVRYTIQSIFR